MLRHTTLCAFVGVMLAMGSTYAQGRGGGGACDKWTGNAWGLCNAYCEAKACGNPNQNGSDNSCIQIYKNFINVAGEDAKMPCKNTAPAAPQSTGNCPCNFDVESWTNNQTQILKRSNLSLCTGELNNCITCDIKNGSFGSFTSLSVLVNLFDGSVPEPEDSLFFFTTKPSDLAGGTCGVDVSLSSGFMFTTPGNQLPLSSDQFPACISDMGALQNAYVALCSQSPPR